MNHIMHIIMCSMHSKSNSLWQELKGEGGGAAWFLRQTDHSASVAGVAFIPHNIKAILKLDTVVSNQVIWMLRVLEKWATYTPFTIFCDVVYVRKAMCLWHRSVCISVKSRLKKQAPVQLDTLPIYGVKCIKRIQLSSHPMVHYVISWHLWIQILRV